MSDKLKDDLTALLEGHGQLHLLTYWDKLNDEQRDSLAKHILSINFNAFNRGKEQIEKREANSTSDETDDVKIEPVPSSIHGSIERLSPEERSEIETIGLTAIAEGKVAVITLAGGQGTRLNTVHPKGMYCLGLLSGKTLFQLQAERLIKVKEAARRLTGSCKGIPWYIMTSEHTLKDTKEFLENHKYFQFPRDEIYLFEQDDLPAVHPDGKIAMTDTWKMGTAPDGNGGLFSVLEKAGVLADMQKRGVTCVHVYCVDNILVRIADPLFIGFSLKNNADCSAKVVKKVRPEEAVGVVCKCGPSYKIVEYSEISPELASQRDCNGDLVFCAGNICNHFFTCEFLEDIAKHHCDKMKFHLAFKKMKCLDMTTGQIVNPTKPNVFKFEKFIFDVIPFSRHFYIWEVDRASEFSPLKNADGAQLDTPACCRRDLENLHRKWLVDNKIALQDGENVDGDRPLVEISPLVSYGGEGLHSLKAMNIPLHSNIDMVEGSVTLSGTNMVDNGVTHLNGDSVRQCL